MDVSNLITRQHDRFPESSTARTHGGRHRSSRLDSQSQPQGSPDVAIKTEASNDDTRTKMREIPSGNSPTTPAKQITFELLLPELPQQRARLPMRVNIFPHDTTDSIITTVKNFYGLYESNGVCFEDRAGNTLIARYENFHHSMVVYVRIVYEGPEVQESGEVSESEARSAKKRRLEEPIQTISSSLNQQSRSRPASRNAARRSISPQLGHIRRSASAATNSKSGSRAPHKNRQGASQDGAVVFSKDSANCFSDSDAGSASVTSSRRERNDQLASAEISLDNILEGGRRNRAKFDSSELPLFVPPQVPITASTSSISPQRRHVHNNGASPMSLMYTNNYIYGQPLPSPQSYNSIEGLNMPTTKPANSMCAPSSHVQGPQLRARGAAQYHHSRQPTSGLILPTPDPTVGSVISDEDVALQLMRLGEASNFSTHGRTSTSTVDDALSGKAEVASSVEGSDDDSVTGRKVKPINTSVRSRTSAAHGLASINTAPHGGLGGDFSKENYYEQKGRVHGYDSDEVMRDVHAEAGLARVKGLEQRHLSAGELKKSQIPKRKTSTKSAKARSTPTSSKTPKKIMSTCQIPPQSPSVSAHSRKASVSSTTAQSPMLPDEEDLSSKPRCQRCRKSKKGCDRQRPCQRCKDAGIGVEGCISEEEGNGRKGRYGRHMGVPVKKTSMESLHSGQFPVAGTFSPYVHEASITAEDKNKKRKK